MLAVDNNLISILSVVGRKFIFMDQAEGQYVSYSFGVKPYSIGISGEVTNFVGVCHSCVTMDTYIFPIKIISYTWELFSVDECVACRLVVDKE